MIGYCRVSTEQQGDSGLSIAAQREKIAHYAAAYELAVVDVLEEVASAKSLSRPVLEAALGRLDAGEADGLLVAKLDRLTRSVKDLGALIETHFGSKFALLSVADAIDTRTAGGRLVLNVLASVSQWEREAIAERTRDALRQLKARGKRLGAPPIEGEVVYRVRELDAAGASLREIAETLTREGERTMKGGAWRAETVRKILRRGT